MVLGAFAIVDLLQSSSSPTTSSSLAPWLLAWYVALCAVAVANPLLLAAVRKHNPPSSDPGRAKYQRYMFLLSIPMVFECAWRSVFPSLYLQVEDTPPNDLVSCCLLTRSVPPLTALHLLGHAPQLDHRRPHLRMLRRDRLDRSDCARSRSG